MCLYVKTVLQGKIKENRDTEVFVGVFLSCSGWSGGAMVLGKLPVPGVPPFWITVGQEPTALAVGSGWGLFGHFYSHLSFSLLFLPLFGRRSDID